VSSAEQVTQCKAAVLKLSGYFKKQPKKSDFFPRDINDRDFSLILEMLLCDV